MYSTFVDRHLGIFVVLLTLDTYFYNLYFNNSADVEMLESQDSQICESTKPTDKTKSNRIKRMTT